MRTLIVSSLLVLAAAAHAAVDGPWITSDRTVDCSSYETILKDVLKEGMTEEEKALALFYFFRQRVYHYQNMPESRIPLKTVNVLGNTLCGSQATCMKGLLAAAGIKARVVSHPGHTFYEAFYDGKWHGYDTMTNFYCFTRGEKKNVASFEELNKDPSLIDTAEAEGRNAPFWGPCGDKPEWFKAAIKVTDYEPGTSDWHVKDYFLRPGEELVRSWWPHGKPLPGTWSAKNGPGPIHTCGTKDRKAEPESFKFWEPYGVPKLGPSTTVSYRHYFNGWMNYAPDLTGEAYKDKLLSERGVKATTEGLAGEGEIVVPFKCPFYVTGGVVYVEATCKTAGDAVEVLASADGKKWDPVLTAAESGTKQVRGEADKTIVRAKTGRHDYQLKFAIKGGAVLNHFYIRTWFQHNAMAAPHLMPGKNKVTVTCANPDAAKVSPISVIYRYKDAPNWSGELKTIEHTGSECPFTFEAELPESEKLPQMQDLTIRCGVPAWKPDTGEKPDRVLVDFSDAKSLENWGADADIALSHDGTGMVLEVAKASKYPQAYTKELKEDWSGYKCVEVELENLGPKAQEIALRVRSNANNEQRTDIGERLGKGKQVLRVPIAGLTKTKVDAIDKVYLMTVGVPEEGCKIRVTKITLIPDRSF